eukprot:SAG31_NODE_18525_length_633_cov_0.752809_1_plen_73_part_01
MSCCLEQLSAAVWRGDLQAVRQLLLKPHVDHLSMVEKRMRQQLATVNAALNVDVKTASAATITLKRIRKTIAE